MNTLEGIKYECPQCNKWWIAMDDSQELPNGDTYCPYCDDYTCDGSNKVFVDRLRITRIRENVCETCTRTDCHSKIKNYAYCGAYKK